MVMNAQTQIESTEGTQPPSQGGTDIPPSQPSEPVVEPPAIPQSGAERVQRPTTPRTPSMEELSAKDMENARLREAVAAQALESQIAQVEGYEAQQKAADKAAIDAGDITDEEATKRERFRLDDYRQRAEHQHLTSTLQQMVVEGDHLGRALMAEQMARKYRVDGVTLFKDASLTTRAQMEVAAKEQRVTKRESDLEAGRTGNQVFSSNLRGGGGAAIDNMSAEEKIRYALRDMV
jgi:hypothetical protein